MNLSVVNPCEKYWNIGKYSVITHFMSLIFLPLKKSENQRFSGVFRAYNKIPVDGMDK